MTAWSIFTQGGGPGAAVTWAEDLLAAIGAPDTPGNERMVYDWERSEGGGGQFNPLNQGPDPSHPGWSGGQQFGGGAAAYDSWQHGLIGAKDYLDMPNYTGIRDALRRNDPNAAVAALWASPWASSHYGYGRAWNTSALPGGEIALPINPGSGGGRVQTTAFHLPGILGDLGNLLNPAAWLSTLEQAFQSAVSDLEQALLRDFVIGAVVLAGAGLIAVGAYKAATGGRNPVTDVKEAGNQATEKAAQVAPLAAAAAV